MITAEEFVDLFKDNEVRECKKTYTGLATISGVSSNKVEVVIDGEREASGKFRNYLSSYSPKIGDRVFVVRDIVLGSLK